MASAKKQLRVLLAVLDDMEVKYKEDIDLDGAKAKLEKAIEGGKAPSKLDEEQATILQELGYDVELPKKSKKSKDDEDDENDEEEKPEKKSTKDWFIAYFKEHKTPLRNQLKEDYLKEFGKDKENTLHGALWRAKTNPEYLNGKIMVEDRVLRLTKKTVEAEEEKPTKKKSKPEKKVSKRSRDEEE